MSPARSNAIVPLALALALAALAGTGCGSEETRPPAPPAAAPAPTPPPEAAAPTPPAPATPPAPTGEVMEWTGELPSDFPGDVPRYPGAKVTSAQGTGELGVAVTFDSADSIDAVAKFYADSLAAMGWQTQTQEIDEGAMIFADKEDRILQAMVHAGGQGTLVDMIIAPAQ